MGEQWESMGWFWGKSSRVRVVPRSYLPAHTHSPASMSLHKASPSLLTTLPSVTQPRRLPRATYFTPPRARSHLPTHALHTPLTPAKEPGGKKKALGSPQHHLNPSSMPLLHHHHLPFRSARKRVSISSPSSRLGLHSRGNLCLLGLAFPLHCALLYLLASAHKHQLCITGDE